MKAWRLAGRICRDAAIWVAIAVISFPLLWMLLTSVRPRDETISYPPTLLLDHVTFAHYRRLLFNTPFLTFFLNSLFVATVSTVVAVLFATAGAYGLTRFHFPGRTAMARMVLFAYLLPAVVLLVPLYVVVAALGLGDSLWGLVITYVTFALPFALWLLRSFIAALPPDIEAAATIDGAGRFAVLFEIVIPQAWPGIIATAVFTFIMAYNEYLYALVFINADSMMTLPPGVMRMVKNSYDIDWNVMMAAAVVITAPILVLFACVQRNFGQGLGAGSVKG
jgi:ABC-type glycerol-3-phosphate transport system permease component